jgi:hypothetical protein
VTQEYLTTAEVAERYHKTPQTINRWRKARTGPKHTRIGKTILYSIAELRIWEAAQAEAAGVPETVQPELDRFAKQLGLNMATSEGIQRFGRALAEDEAARIAEAGDNDRTDLGVA